MAKQTGRSVQLSCVVFLLLCLLFGSLNAEEFSGRVDYAVIVTPEIPPRISDSERERLKRRVKQVRDLLGDSCSMWFAPGQLKVRTNGLFAEDIYQIEQGRILRLELGKDMYNVLDAYEPLDQVFGYDSLAETREILGYECNAVQLTRKRSSSIYYYAPALELNPQSFQQVRFENWNVYTNLAAAVPLEIIQTKKRDKYTVRYVAMSVKSMDPIAMEPVFRPSTQISEFAALHQKEVYLGLRKIQTLKVGRLMTIQVSKSFYMKDPKRGEAAWVIVNHGYAANIGIVAHEIAPETDRAATQDATQDNVVAILNERIAQTRKGLQESSLTQLESITIDRIGSIQLAEVHAKAGKSMSVNYLFAGFIVKGQVVTIRIESPAAEYDYLRTEYLKIIASVLPQ